jgi:hypothetical protein
MKKTQPKKTKKPATRVSVTSEEKAFIKFICGQMKKDGTRSWYQIHGTADNAIIESLKAKGLLRFDGQLKGYVLTGKELPF